MSGQLIIALDFPDRSSASMFVSQLSPSLCKLKVGFELFVAAGPDFVRDLVVQGYDVFLDLKFHDIPNTVAAACRAAAELGVWMINVHASGGEEMMAAARDSMQNVVNPPKLIAVTVLTSMNCEQLQKIGVATDDPQMQVRHLAELAATSGLNGVVCSAQEAVMLKQHMGKAFVLVTPGIRPEGSDHGDQARVMTPKQAAAAGIDYIVVGRPITQAEAPLAVIEQINLALS